MGFSPADCEALLSLAKGLSYQIGIKYGYCEANLMKLYRKIKHNEKVCCA